MNPDLVLALYPGKEGVKKSHHDKPADDPYYIWTGFASLRWRTKQEGFRRLHIVVKLADGKWFVSEESVPESSEWQISEMAIPPLRWRVFDSAKVVEGARTKPDLTRVAEIGFTDLMTGGGSRASSRIDWIEVYARPVWRIRFRDNIAVSRKVDVDWPLVRLYVQMGLARRTLR